MAAARTPAAAYRSTPYTRHLKWGIGAEGRNRNSVAILGNADLHRGWPGGPLCLLTSQEANKTPEVRPTAHAANLQSARAAPWEPWMEGKTVARVARGKAG